MDELFIVCRASNIPDAQAVGFVLAQAQENGKPKPWPIIITRKGSKYNGFENVCPHGGKRIDANPGQFLDEEGNFLTCGHHRSQFDLDTGECFIGPCQGSRLKPIKLVIDDGDLCVTGVKLAEEDGLDLPEPDAMPDVTITSD